jgi:hypothetical protein
VFTVEPQKSRALLSNLNAALRSGTLSAMRQRHQTADTRRRA